jgi:hypothetical protein
MWCCIVWWKFTDFWRSLTLKMEEVCDSKTPVNFYQTTWYYIPEDYTSIVTIIRNSDLSDLQSDWLTSISHCNDITVYFSGSHTHNPGSGAKLSSEMSACLKYTQVYNPEVTAMRTWNTVLCILSTYARANFMQALLMTCHKNWRSNSWLVTGESFWRRPGSTQDCRANDDDDYNDMKCYMWRGGMFF